MTAAHHEIREFANDLKVLDGVREMIADAVARGGFQAAYINRLQIAVDEAVTNIIEHGYGDQPPGSTTFTMRIDANPDEFRVEILDRGARYDQPPLEDIDIQRHVAAGRTGGLGVFLMRRIMDVVDYQYETGRHNRLVMVKKRG
jgi:serine/threonine-protein kinase RsbW